MVKQFINLFSLTSVWSSKSISVFSNREAVSLHFSIKGPICRPLVPWKLVWYSPAACNFWDYDILTFSPNFLFLSGFSSANIYNWQEIRLLYRAHLRALLAATLERKSVTTKLRKKQISPFTSWAMLKQFYYLTTNFHERFVSFTYFLGQKVSTVVTIAKVTKCFFITCCYVKCYSAYLLRRCTAL